MSLRAVFLGLVITLLCLMIIQDPARGAATGKIAGQVTDDQGKVLPGVNVVLVGTKRGAVSDAKGFYAILLVDPGTYEMEASLIGFQKVKQKEVRVLVDFTTTINFRLKETAVESQEVVVTAERPAVEPDKTASKYYVTAEDVARMPVVKDTKLIAGLMPGVQHDGQGIRMSSLSLDYVDGQPGENRGFFYAYQLTNPYPVGITYTVDGVRMVNNDAVGVNMFTGVNRSSIQEVSIVMGVPEAEYGNMNAGSINIVTKQGGRDYHGFMEYRYTRPGQKHFGYNAYDPILHLDPATGKSHIRSTDPNWLRERENIGPDGIPGTADDTGRLVHVQPDDYTKVAGNRMEASLSGPVGSKASFHFSYLTDMQPAQRPWPALRDLFNYQLTGKLSFNLTPKISLKVGGVFGRDKVFQGTALGDGRNIYLPAWQSGGGYDTGQNSMAYVVLTHSLSPKTLYEVRLSRSDNKHDTLNVPLDQGTVVRDADGWFTVKQNNLFARGERQTRYNLKLDFSSQVTKGNFLKAGIDATWYRSWEWVLRGNSPGNWNVESTVDYYEAAKNLNGKDGKMDSVPIRAGTKYTPDLKAAGHLDDPVWNSFRDYPVKPFQLSAYVQDKMEFEGMVVNLGLRVDSFLHRTQSRAEMFWTFVPQFQNLPDFMEAMRRQGQKPYPQDPMSFPTWGGKTMFHVSPRVGVSHPITSRSAIHFAYGRFFLLPYFYTMYGRTWINAAGLDARVDLNKDGQLSSYEALGGLTTGRFRAHGTTRLDAAITDNYEVGMDWNFISDYTASVTAYYRRADGYPFSTGTRILLPEQKRTENGAWYSNAMSEEERGLELALSKRFSSYFSFRATYSWYWGQNNLYNDNSPGFYPDSNFIASGTYRYNFTIDPQTGMRIWLPLTDADIKSLGAYADTQIRQQINAGADIRPSPMFQGYAQPGAAVGMPYVNEQNIVVTNWTAASGGVRGPNSRRDAPGDGSITLQFTTPSGFGPSLRGFHLLSDLNVNLVHRIEPGTFFSYKSPVPSGSTNDQVVNNTLMFRNATGFTTDLGVEKGFHVGHFRPVVFFEATNLFNGEVPHLARRWTFFNDIPMFGLAENQPNPEVKRQSTAVWNPWDSYRNRTRELYFGVRMSM